MISVIDIGNERLRDTLEILKNYKIRFVYPGCNAVKILLVLILQCCKDIISSDFTMDELN